MTYAAPDYNRAKQLALDTLEANMIVKPPVIAADLAESAGLKVVRATFKLEYAHIAGFIDTDEMSIVVNAEEPAVRRNFTIAHELGHYLLKHHESSEYSVLLRNTSTATKTPMEQEANVFAANLLVPDVFLRECIDKYPFATDEQLGRLFGVSAEVIRYRKLYER